jgi:hypothetical protein
LNKDNPTYPLRVIVQQFRECAQLLYDPLHDVQLIASNDDLLPSVELEEGVQFRLNAWTIAGNEPQQTEVEANDLIGDNSQVTRDAIRVDTDGSVHDSGDMALYVDTARGNLISTDSHA